MLRGVASGLRAQRPGTLAPPAWCPRQTWQVGVPGAEKAQGPNAVVERDHDDVAPCGNLLPVVEVVAEKVGPLAGPHEEGASIDPDHDGQVVGD